MQQERNARNGQTVDVKHKTMESFAQILPQCDFSGFYVILEEMMQVGSRICQYFPSPKCHQQLGTGNFNHKSRGHYLYCK